MSFTSKKKKKNYAILNALKAIGQPWPFDLVENEKKLANLPSPEEVRMQIFHTIFL